MTSERSKLRVSLLIALMLSLILYYFYGSYNYIVVSGPSMAPTFNDGQVIIIDKKVDPHALCVGDVVIFRDPEQSKESKDVLVKRIYALGPKRIYVLPTIRMSNPNEGPIVTGYQIVQFHGSDYDRQRAFDGRLREYDVQVDQVFVTGDNPPESEDSRVFGAVKIEDIRGVVLWPNTRRT